MSNMQGWAIETSHLTKRFKGQVAVRDLNLHVTRGSFFGLLGPNGAGKSTTLGMLTTLVRPSAGTATVAGHEIGTSAKKVREKIGVVLQNISLDFDLSVRANLDFQARLHHLSGNKRTLAVADALQLSGLEHRIGDRVGTLSGGLRRRLEIARSLIQTPEILFLDEPTAGLDPESRASIWQELERLREQKEITIVLTTHYLEEAERLADTVAIIDDGKIKAQGSPRELKESLGGTMVRASVVEPDRQLEGLLLAAEGCEECTITGNEITLRISDSDSCAVLFDLMRKHCKKVLTFRLETPSLENVFLARTGHAIHAETTD
jgi:ABC-2 type transport system ATP-binding protein